MSSIDKGVSPGDVVVVTGVDKLREGSPVAMQASDATAGNR